MPQSVDFQALKREVSIERVCAWLGIELKRSGEQLRGCCPLCGGDNPRAFVVTPAKDLWYAFCSGCQCGGDQLELVARLRKVPIRDAALEVQRRFAPAPEADIFEPLDYLEASHAAVAALGFPEEVARALGIGFAPKGIMRGRVCIPLRAADGTLVAYAGINIAADPMIKLPSRFRL